uniref:Uncharacterized protein LOC105035860 n=1 Tax=Elaeis guineensis var. tenera TaxID=51953 RepID=A0A6I9QHX8_ELAGV|nr:uncharacterized protein LOC105035860 [Elaeis guineensis]
MRSSEIQKDIVNACATGTINDIVEDLGEDYFGILVDESRDASHKEQMALVLRYIDRRGPMMERFIGIIHVRDTSTLSLKKIVDSLLSNYSLSPSYIRGQCNDGASNMQGASFRHRKDIQEDQAKNLQETLRAGELETGWGLNQQLDLKRAGDTHWGSHYKYLINFSAMFGSLIDVLDNIASDTHDLDDRFKA